MTMKKTIFLLTFVCLVLIVACNKDKTTSDTPNLTSLHLENAQLIFLPDGGEDTIRVYEGKGLEAVASYSWCSVTVLADTAVAVKVNAYKGLESRFCPISITSPTSSNSVVIQQSGVYIQNFDDSDIPLKNGARQIVRTFSSNASFTATTKADWIHLTTDESSLTIDIDENDGKQYREAWVAWAVGDLKDTIFVSQFDAIDAGMMGNYVWKGKNVKNNRDWTINATLSATSTSEDTYNLALTSNTYNLNIPVQMDKQTLLIPLGQAIGTYTTSNGVVHTVIPVIAQGTSAIKYSDVINSGYYKLLFSRSDEEKWNGVADHSDYAGYNFQFANWLKTDDYLSVNSKTNGIYLQNITLEQQ